ncbi:flippase [Pygmaiobacter massiliensis]|uniref:flippase n=1 Tax=Pygmaiobacter massiliensis TaxID=1917873 RepID=UPI000C7D466A|nr:flippase [Pygmaiobacter massiliensis]
MEQTASIKKNYILNTANQLMSIIVPLITAPYLARVLTANGIGIQSYTNSIVTYFTLFAVMGSSSFGQREIAYSRDDKYKMTKSFWNIMAFRGITTIATLVGYWLFIDTAKQYKIYFLILSINIINVGLDVTWLFQGIEEFTKIVTRSVAVRLVHCVCIFLFIRTESDLWLYLLMTCGFNAVGYLIMWIYVPRYVGKPTELKPFENAKGIFLLFLPTISTQIYVILDKSMIGWITQSTYQNGCYEQAEKIARISLTVVTSISTVVLPRIANLYKKDKIEEAKSILYQGYRFVFLLSIPMTLGLITIADIFVPVFFGEGYEMAIPLLRIFGMIMIPISLAHITGYSYLIPTGQQNVYTISVTIAACANLVINIISIPTFGAIGAAVGSVTAEITGILIQIIFCLATKQLNARCIFRGVWKYLFSAIVMALNIRVVALFAHCNIWGLLQMIAVGVISYITLIVILRDEFFCNNSKKFLLLFFKKLRR